MVSSLFVPVDLNREKSEDSIFDIDSIQYSYERQGRLFSHIENKDGGVLNIASERQRASAQHTHSSKGGVAHKLSAT